MRYPGHAPLVDPARPTAAIWRLALGVVAITAVFLALSLVYGWLCMALLPPEAWGADGRGIELATTPLGALVNLYAFGMLILALAIVLPLVHKRGLGSVIGRSVPALRQAGRVVPYILGVYFAASALQLIDPIPLEPGLAFAQWLPLVPVILLGLLIQTGAEELIFRGYLQSQLAARFRHPAVWLLLPSVIFGMLHFQPGVMGDAAWLVVLWATLFGLVAADLTARCGTLGPAIALHLLNNFAAIGISAPSGYFDGLALVTYPFGPGETDLLMQWMPVDLGILVCSYLAARVALRV